MLPHGLRRSLPTVYGLHYSQVGHTSDNQYLVHDMDLVCSHEVSDCLSLFFFFFSSLIGRNMPYGTHSLIMASEVFSSRCWKSSSSSFCSQRTSELTEQVSPHLGLNASAWPFNLLQLPTVFSLLSLFISSFLPVFITKSCLLMWLSLKFGILLCQPPE